VRVVQRKARVHEQGAALLYLGNTDQPVTLGPSGSSALGPVVSSVSCQISHPSQKPIPRPPKPMPIPNLGRRRTNGAVSTGAGAR
jgi:hypothetical protein